MFFPSVTCLGTRGCSSPLRRIAQRFVPLKSLSLVTTGTRDTLKVVQRRKVVWKVFVHASYSVSIFWRTFWRGFDLTILFSLGLHCEGRTARSLFGVFFWKILYLPIADAFRTKHQGAPLDLDSPHFYSSRKNKIEKRWVVWSTNGSSLFVSLHKIDRYFRIFPLIYFGGKICFPIQRRFLSEKLDQIWSCGFCIHHGCGRWTPRPETYLPTNLPQNWEGVRWPH